MNDPLDAHPHFTRWEDPGTGVINYALTERLAPIQRALYFITPSISQDGQWLWFMAMFPPSRHGILAAVSLDPDQPKIQLYPQALLFGNPMLSPSSDGVYVPVENGIHFMDLNGAMRRIFRMPKELLKDRHLFRLVTDLTVSCDGKHLLLDSLIGDKTLISLVSIDSGEMRQIRWFDRDLHHAQFSYHDPTLFMLGESPYYHPLTGRKTPIDRRMWLMDTSGKRCEPLFEDLHFGVNCSSCHEWWTREGKVQWCDYDDGIYEADIETRERKLIWPHPMIHGQVDPSGRFICGDYHPYKWSHKNPCGVFLFDRENEKEIALASSMPMPKVFEQENDWRSFHLDPHPHFSPDGRYVVYSGTPLNKSDVVLASVPSAVAQMKG